MIKRHKVGGGSVVVDEEMKVFTFESPVDVPWKKENGEVWSGRIVGVDYTGPNPGHGERGAQGWAHDDLVFPIHNDLGEVCKEHGYPIKFITAQEVTPGDGWVVRGAASLKCLFFRGQRDLIYTFRILGSFTDTSNLYVEGERVFIDRDSCVRLVPGASYAAFTKVQDRIESGKSVRFTCASGVALNHFECKVPGHGRACVPLCGADGPYESIGFVEGSEREFVRDSEGVQGGKS